MAYQECKDMVLSEFSVKRAVKEISAKSDDSFTFTYEDIADYIGCGVMTIKRAMPRLLEARVIKKTGSPRNGFRYEVREHEPASVL